MMRVATSHFNNLRRPYYKNPLLYAICGTIGMADENSIRFTLFDGTDVCVKKVTDNKYDFELKLKNGNRKTFVWTKGDGVEFKNSKGISDMLVKEAIEKLKALIDQPA